MWDIKEKMHKKVRFNCLNSVNLHFLLLHCIYSIYVIKFALLIHEFFSLLHAFATHGNLPMVILSLCLHFLNCCVLDVSITYNISDLVILHLLGYQGTCRNQPEEFFGIVSSLQAYFFVDQHFFMSS